MLFLCGSWLLSCPWRGTCWKCRFECEVQLNTARPPCFALLLNSLTLGFHFWILFVCWLQLLTAAAAAAAAAFPLCLLTPQRGGSCQTRSLSWPACLGRSSDTVSLAPSAPHLSIPCRSLSYPPCFFLGSVTTLLYNITVTSSSSDNSGRTFRPNDLRQIPNRSGLELPCTELNLYYRNVNVV